MGCAVSGGVLNTAVNDPAEVAACSTLGVPGGCGWKNSPIGPGALTAALDGALTTSGANKPVNPAGAAATAADRDMSSVTSEAHSAGSISILASIFGTAATASAGAAVGSKSCVKPPAPDAALSSSPTRSGSP